jgi:Tetracyclin repressor-like, C-terminal domain
MPNALALAEWVLGALDASALSASDKLQVHVMLHSFIQGLAVNLDAEAQAVGDTGISEEEHMRLHEARFEAIARSGRFPYFAKMLKEIPASFELDLDTLFELGLARLLDGFTPLIEAPAPKRRRSVGRG